MLGALIGTVVFWMLGGAVMIPILEHAEEQFENNGVDGIDLALLVVFAVVLTVVDTIALNLFPTDISVLLRIIGQVLTAAVVLGVYSLVFR